MGRLLNYFLEPKELSKEDKQLQYTIREFSENPKRSVEYLKKIKSSVTTIKEVCSLIDIVSIGISISLREPYPLLLIPYVEFGRNVLLRTERKQKQRLKQTIDECKEEYLSLERLVQSVEDYEI